MCASYESSQASGPAHKSITRVAACEPVSGTQNKENEIAMVNIAILEHCTYTDLIAAIECKQG